MTASAAKAWTLLNARGVQFEGARGGIPDITAADLARMLMGLPLGPFYAGMVKESGDVRCLGRLERLLWVESLGLRHHRDPATAYCRSMAGLAVYEFLFPRPSKCSTCNGRGWVKQEGQGVQCEHCGNAGGTKLTAKFRAELVGVPVAHWDRYSGLYEHIHGIVQGWHSHALRHLARAMADEEIEDEA